MSNILKCFSFVIFISIICKMVHCSKDFIEMSIKPVIWINWTSLNGEIISTCRTIKSQFVYYWFNQSKVIKSLIMGWVLWGYL